jgi:asparagine synthase (glutamine-hydrolysing)
MCGIAGIIGLEFDNSILKILEIMDHRGPNHKGIWRAEGITLGHSRLSIIDLSEKGNQPMESFCGRYQITFNGEIYNFKELKSKLLGLGISFKSDSDTEVIVNLFSIFGKESVKMLRGMFAFGIWDKQSKSLFVARDHMGIKPLLYFWNKDVFVFASEIKSMVASRKVPLSYNKESIIQFLNQGHVIQPNTILEKVFMLLPGTYGVFINNQFTTEAFWEFPNMSKPDLKISYEDAVLETRMLVNKSVKEELMSDVPLGLFLSGGLDSSVLAAACKQVGSGRIKTYSIGFGEEGSSIDETTLAKEMAQFVDTEHYSFKINSTDLLNNFDKFVWGLDQPSIDGLNSYFVSQKAKEHVTVALSGLGGDEVFSGYGWVKSLMKIANNNPVLIEKYIQNRSFVPTIFRGRFDKYFSNFNISSAYMLSNNVFFPSEIEMFSNLTVNNKTNVFRILMDSYKNVKIDDNQVNSIAAFDCFYYMTSRLLRDSDCVAMAHSLEVRFPLIDHRIVELVMSLPSNYRLDKNYLNSSGIYEDDFNFEHHKVKKLLYDAFSSDLPEQFGKRKKTGFKLPMEQWLKGDLKSFMDEHMSLDSIFFERKDIERVYKNFANGNCSWVQPWSILVLNSFDKSLKSIVL